MYLIFDTETTGLPKSWKAPVFQVNNWPRVIQMAWQVFDAAGDRIDEYSGLVRPEGFVIPVEAEKVHGISTAAATEHGTPIAQVLEKFRSAISRASLLVGHNINFDMNVVGAEFFRLENGNPLAKARRLCTMEVSTNFCAIPGKYGFKWPTLPELHERLFGESVKELHDAKADVETCARCFFELKRLGVF